MASRTSFERTRPWRSPFAPMPGFSSPTASLPLMRTRLLSGCSPPSTGPAAADGKVTLVEAASAAADASIDDVRLRFPLASVDDDGEAANVC